MAEDFYKILGVSKDSDHGTIKKAYRKLARKWHPDIKTPSKNSRIYPGPMTVSETKKNARTMMNSAKMASRQALMRIRPDSTNSGVPTSMKEGGRQARASEGTKVMKTFLETSSVLPVVQADLIRQAVVLGRGRLHVERMFSMTWKSI
jgi:hypothetical protein